MYLNRGGQFLASDDDQLLSCKLTGPDIVTIPSDTFKKYCEPALDAFKVQVHSTS